MPESKQQLSRFAAIFAGGTMFSRVLGLVRDVVVAAMIPEVSRDAFLFAFKLPNMLRDMLGEGATNAAFVPVFAESQEKDSPEEYRRLVRAVMSAMLVLLALITVLGVALMPVLPGVLNALRPLTNSTPKEAAELATTVRLMQWTFPYLFLIGMAVFAMAPLFVAKHYGTPSWSPLLLNVALIACCLLGRDWFPDPAWALVAGVWLGGIAQLAAMYWAMRRHAGVLWPSFELRHPGIPKAFLLLGPVIVGQATGEVNKLVDNFFAYSLESGTVTALFYANRLVQLPLSVFGIAVAVAILPSISRASVQGKEGEIRDTLLHGLRQTFFLVAPAMALLLLLREPIIRLLFERGHFDPATTERASTALLYYALGLLSFAWVKVSVQGFYAVQNTKTPVIIASASMFLNILLNCALVGPMGFRGLALSTSISFTINFVLLYVLLSERFGALWNAETGRVVVRILLAVGLMVAAAYGTSVRVERLFGVEGFGGKLAAVALPLGVAGAIYLLVCWVFRVPELIQFITALQNRREPSR